MNRTAIVTTLVVGALLMPAAASSHGGGISNSQSCDTGTVVTAHLDSDVASSATWTVTGSVTANGTGPGPADLGPWSAPSGAGSATLTIVFEAESNVYTTTWPAITGCEHPGPTPTPTATPRPTPHPTPTPPAPVIKPPHITWRGPCGDPMHGVVLYAGSRNTRFLWTRHDGGRVVTRAYYVLHGLHRFTGWKHADGGTLMVVTARGRVWTHRAAAAGNYRACSS